MQHILSNGLPLTFIRPEPQVGQGRYNNAGVGTPAAATSQAPTPVTAAPPIQGRTAPASQPGLLPHQSILDHVIFALTGTPTSMRTPAEQHQQAQGRKQAADESVQASLNPGDSYMWAPGTGSAGGGPGGGFGLSDIMRLFRAGASLIAPGAGGA